MSTPRELQAQLEEAQHALREAEKEIDRQRKEAAAAAETPDDARALIAAISKVDLPAFWEADPVLWFRQCDKSLKASSSTMWWASYRTPSHSRVAHCYSP